MVSGLVPIFVSTIFLIYCLKEPKRRHLDWYYYMQINKDNQWYFFFICIDFFSDKCALFLG